MDGMGEEGFEFGGAVEGGLPGSAGCGGAAGVPPPLEVLPIGTASGSAEAPSLLELLAGESGEQQQQQQQQQQQGGSGGGRAAILSDLMQRLEAQRAQMAVLRQKLDRSEDGRRAAEAEAAEAKHR